MSLTNIEKNHLVEHWRFSGNLFHNNKGLAHHLEFLENQILEEIG